MTEDEKTRAADGSKWAVARRSAVFGLSVWNEIDRLISRHPDVIYFGSGAPASELYPLARMQEAAQAAWANAGGALDYGEVEGYLPLRQLIARRMGAQGIRVDPAHLMMTTGSQQGIDHVAKLMLDPGDLIVVEGPTYIGAMQAFDPYEPTYLAVPVDGEGLDVAELARALDRAERAPKFIYTIPTFQNPTGFTMTLARRIALTTLARARGILLLEDDPYGEIHFGDPPPPALRALDPDVIYLGTFSKTIAPGIRVGWLAAPADLIGMLLMVKEAADIHGDRMIMRTVHNIADGFLDGHVASARAIYRRRRDALLAGLDEHMPAGTVWSKPEGGFFVWLTLPPGLDSDEFLPFAAERGVAFLPGSYFYPKGWEVRTSLRLNFSTLSEERIAEGARRLGAALLAFMEQKKLPT
ncbi:MAG: PLP-dependent aminotransferase family protein [Thermomicrobiales bacterium]